jgi:hypothetical protein
MYECTYIYKKILGIISNASTCKYEPKFVCWQSNILGMYPPKVHLYINQMLHIL